jgi:4-amino-4-deoxychorismate lyase
LPGLPDSLYRNGKPLQLLKLPRNTPEGAFRLKSLHYMNNILAKRELAGYPYAAAEGAEGLLLTCDGYVAEGIVSNVFWVRSGILYTPSLETGILSGITRAAVLAAAERIGMPIQEGLYRWDDLRRADEIFVTSSIQELVPINALYSPNGNRIAIGGNSSDINAAAECLGQWTGRLLASYRKAIAEMGSV